MPLIKMSQTLEKISAPRRCAKSASVQPKWLDIDGLRFPDLSQISETSRHQALDVTAFSRMLLFGPTAQYSYLAKLSPVTFPEGINCAQTSPCALRHHSALSIAIDTRLPLSSSLSFRNNPCKEWLGQLGVA